MLSIAKQSLALTQCLPKTCTVSCSVKVYIHQESHLFWVLMVPNYSLKPYKTNESLSFPFCISFKPHFIAQKLLVLHKIIKFSQFYYIRKQLIRYIFISWLLFIFQGYYQKELINAVLYTPLKYGKSSQEKEWGHPKISLEYSTNHEQK